MAKATRKKIITSVSITALVFAVASPFLFSKIGPQMGVIEYRSSCEGILIEENGYQYGRAGDQAAKIIPTILSGFVFTEWNDGLTTPERTDLFTNRKQTFYASGKFGLEDLPLLVIRSDKISSKKDKIEASIIFGEAEETTSCSICISSDYENWKRMPKQDYDLSFGSPTVFFGGPRLLRLSSLYYDRTMRHSFFAYNVLRDSLPQLSLPKWQMANVLIKATYAGVYSIQELPNRNSSFTKPNNPLLVSFSHVGGEEAQLNSSFAVESDYFTIIDNPAEISIDVLSNVIGSAFNFQTTSQSDIPNVLDLDSVAQSHAINELFKNSANVENDDTYYLTQDGIIHAYPANSFNLSAPLFKWHDTTPAGHAKALQWKEKLYSSSEDYRNMVNGYLETFTTTLESRMGSYESFFDEFNNSLEANNSLWPRKSRFGQTDEQSVLEFNEIVEDYLDWLGARIEWIKGNGFSC